MGVVKRTLSSWADHRQEAVKMKLFLAVTLLAGVMTHPDHGEFNKWAKNKAMESCWGEENMKIWTVRMKKAVAKCSHQDAPELLLPQFRAPYKTVNALLEGQEKAENNNNQFMYQMFRFMYNMMEEQNHHSNNYNQFRPYSKNYDSADNMPMPMKWMMKMMMKNMNHDDDHYVDVMRMRNMDPMESKMDKFEAMFKKMFQNNMNKNYNSYDNMKHNRYDQQKHNMYSNMFDMQNSDMFHSRHTRAAARNNLDLGDRLVEKLQGQKQEMEEKVGNLTCILQEVNVLDNNNEISVSSMKRDLEQYNLPSVWFKENYLELLDTCYQMATTLPAQVGEEYTVQGDFGTVNMAQVKMFMGCCSKAKSKLCMNYDIKQKIEENFGPLNDILSQSGLTENQLFPLVEDLLHGQESVLDDIF